MTEGTCTHIRIIQYVNVHVSSIKTCFDVLIYVQGLLYIFLYIYISAIFIVPIQIVSKTDASYLCFPTRTSG